MNKTWRSSIPYFVALTSREAAEPPQRKRAFLPRESRAFPALQTVRMPRDKARGIPVGEPPTRAFARSVAIHVRRIETQPGDDRVNVAVLRVNGDPATATGISVVPERARDRRLAELAGVL